MTNVSLMLIITTEFIENPHSRKLPFKLSTKKARLKIYVAEVTAYLPSLFKFCSHGKEHYFDCALY